MKSLSILTINSVKLLIRDKIFLPTLILGILIVLLANLASEWVLEDYRKVLFDIGDTGFTFLGSILAIFWGTKSISDSKTEGSLEVQLSGGVSRTTWLVSKYLGLVISLIFIGISLVIAWQFFMLLNDFGYMTNIQLISFGFIILTWCIMASVSVFFASFASQGTAIFSSIALWIIGLIASPVLKTLPQTASPITKQVVDAVYWGFNLQQFNIPYNLDTTINTVRESLLWSGLQGLSIILVFILTATFIFQKQDLSEK